MFAQKVQAFTIREGKPTWLLPMSNLAVAQRVAGRLDDALETHRRLKELNRGRMPAQFLMEYNRAKDLAGEALPAWRADHPSLAYHVTHGLRVLRQHAGKGKLAPDGPAVWATVLAWGAGAEPRDAAQEATGRRLGEEVDNPFAWRNFAEALRNADDPSAALGEECARRMESLFLGNTTDTREDTPPRLTFTTEVRGAAAALTVVCPVESRGGQLTAALARLAHSTVALQGLHDKYKGGTCALIASGPSLDTMDWNKFWAQRWDAVLGLNRIVRALERLGLGSRLDMWVYSAQKLGGFPSREERASGSSFMSKTVKFVPWATARTQFTDDAEVARNNWYFPDMAYSAASSAASRQMLPEWRRGSTPREHGWMADRSGAAKLRHHTAASIMEGTEIGWSNTHVGLQLLHFVGCETVVIVGLDHSRGFAAGMLPTDAKPPPSGNNYDRMEMYYRKSEQMFRRSGRRVVDATPGGRCQVFEKEPWRFAPDDDAGVESGNETPPPAPTVAASLQASTRAAEVPSLAQA